MAITFFYSYEIAKAYLAITYLLKANPPLVYLLIIHYKIIDTVIIKNYYNKSHHI